MQLRYKFTSSSQWWIALVETRLALALYGYTGKGKPAITNFASEDICRDSVLSIHVVASIGRH